MATTKKLWEYRYYCEEIYYFPENFVEPAIACYKNRKLKEDLTIDWLNENCKISAEDMIFDEDCIEGQPCGFDNLKYKCGEYLVKVLR